VRHGRKERGMIDELEIQLVLAARCSTTSVSSIVGFSRSSKKPFGYGPTAEEEETEVANADAESEFCRRFVHGFKS